MHACKHGPAVTVVLLSLLVGPGLAGCRQSGASADEAQADGAAADDARQRQRDQQQQDELPPPQLREDVLDRQPLNVPPDLANLRPVALLPAGEQTMIYNAMGPLRLRVARADGSTLAEVKARSGQVLVVDRRTGVKLAGDVVARGPLDEQAVYALYALPTGGVRQEATQSRIRPETVQEREARRDAEQAQREAEQRETTRPSTSPTGGGT